jgi:Ca-activated chloride channel homolog
VLLSDGESNRGPRPLDIVDQVAARGVRVYTVGVGTAQGIVLSNFGRSMRVRLDETTLKAIAEATDGAYYNASTTADLEAIYKNLGMRVEFRRQQTEITAFFTGFALVVMLGAGVLSLLWFNRVL